MSTLPLGRSFGNTFESSKQAKLVSYLIPSKKDQIYHLLAAARVNAESMAKLQVLLSVVQSLEPFAERAHISDLIAIFRQHFSMSVDAAKRKARQFFDNVIASFRCIEFLRLSSTNPARMWDLGWLSISINR